MYEKTCEKTIDTSEIIIINSRYLWTWQCIRRTHQKGQGPVPYGWRSDLWTTLKEEGRILDIVIYSLEIGSHVTRELRTQWTREVKMNVVKDFVYDGPLSPTSVGDGARRGGVSEFKNRPCEGKRYGFGIPVQ